MAQQYVYVAHKTFGECRLTASKSIGYFDSLSFGLTKQSPYNSAINVQYDFVKLISYN